jgi:ABC-type multidrug transport system fused ATPase/permease subunit
MSFFEVTTFGTIMTRFTQDMYRIDDRLGRFFNSMIGPVVRLLATAVLICAGK